MTNKKVVCLWPYFLIFLLLIFYWGGYIFKSESPLVTVIPGYWSFCGDVAIVNYASYLSGHHVLNDFSSWSFNETLGNNFYSHLLARYYNPFNILGAFLVDSCGLDVFQVFGWVNFLLLYFAAACCFYYFRKVIGYSVAWSLFGASVYLKLPHISYSAHFVNYLGIIAFFPLCLVASDAFYRKPDFKSSTLFMFVLTAPLFFGMVNIYINYLIMAALIAVIYINKNVSHKRQYSVLLLTLTLFIFALLINSAVWGPMLVEMFSSTGQSYLVQEDNGYSNINPLKLLIQLIGPIFNGGQASALQLNWLNNFSVPVSIISFFSQNRIGLLVFIIGAGYFLRKKEMLSANIWLVSMFICAGGYYLLSIFNVSGVMRVLDILKIFKYQVRIAAPFFALFITEGCRVLLQERNSRGFLYAKKFILAVISIIIFAGMFNLWIALNGGVREKINKIIFLFSNSVLGLNNCSFIYRWQIFRDPWHCLWIGYLMLVIAAAAFLFFTVRFNIRNKLFNLIVLAGIIFTIGYYEFFNYGGFSARNEIYAKEYFKPQQNEIIVKGLLKKDSFQYRVLYYDNLRALRSMFPEDLNYQKIALPLENRNTWFQYDTRKYMNRADALGIPIVDGWMVFPAKEKKAYFSSDKTFLEPFPAMSELAWEVVNPYNPKVSDKVNVKYIISRYPLARYTLINKSDDYWAYLYSIEEAKPICTVAGRDGYAIEANSKSGIELFKLSPDRIDIEAKTDRNAIIKLNMALDKYWAASANGHKLTILPIDGIFAGIQITNGKSHIVLKYNYWPQKLFLCLSLLFFVVCLFWLKYLFRRGNYEIDYSDTMF